MTTLRPPVAAVAALGLLAGCTREAEPPAQPVPQTPPVAAPTAPAPEVGYACESGRTVTVRYPDTATALVAYQGQTATLRTAPAASGARFVGSGMEWWTTTQGTQETATLSRLGPNQDVGVAILERCSRPSTGPSAPPAPLPAPGGAMQPMAVPCRSTQLKLSNEGGDAGMGNRVADIGVQNTGAQPCSLTGYPTVTLLDGRGRSLTAIRSEQATGSYFRQGEAPRPVTLAPQAKARFELAWNVVPNEGAGERTCPSAATVRVAAPGDTATTSLSMAFTPCGGRIRVSPLRATDAPLGGTNPAATTL